MTENTAAAALPTERAWLAAQGKANGKQGRFSAEAHALLAAAKAAGMVFAPNASAVKAAAVKAAKPAAAPKPAPVKQVTTSAAPKPPVSTAGVDAKVVRAWALKNGVAVGARGRIHPSVVQAFVAAGGTVEAIAKPTGGVARPTPALMPKVRPNTQAWALVKHRLDKPSARPLLLGVSTCHKGHALTVCPCPVPSTTAQWGSVPLSFTKPTV